LILREFPHYKKEDGEETVEDHEGCRVQIEGLPVAVVAFVMALLLSGIKNRLLFGNFVRCGN
jgi:hypothetical protein